MFMKSYFSGAVALVALFITLQSFDVFDKKRSLEPDPLLLSRLDSATVRQHLMVLSHDSLLGRAPGTLGEEKAIRYIQSVFAKAGLEPAFGGSYTQDVPLLATKVDGFPSLSFKGSGGRSRSLQFVQDFRMFTDFEEERISVNSEMVFAGYGITAKEFAWDDYSGVDVQGKVIVVLDGEPAATESEPNLFKADTLTYYGRFTYKVEEARRRGALGIVIVENPIFFARNRMRATVEQIQLADLPEGRLQMKAFVSNESAAELATMNASTLENWRSLAGTRGFRAQKLSTSIESQTKYAIRRVYGRNVGAILRGSERPDEPIIFTAHHDHLGVGIPDAKGDSIYNGAVDNATGTATVLMLAEAFAKMEIPPKRTIMFLTVTAEESGLLGAYYYNYNPAFPAAKTVANINIDCTNVFGPTYDITAVGPEYSDLGPLLKEKALIEGMELVPFTNIGGGIFFRSDQLPFAQSGIPALYLLSGNKYHEGYEEYVARMSANYASSYHQPSDNFDPEWMMSGTIQQARVAFRMAYALAQSTEWPQWVPGSEFESIRKTTEGSRK
jgi:hypothetical protein